MKTLLATVIILMFSAATISAQTFMRGALRLGMNGGVNVGGEEATLKYADYSLHPYGTVSIEHYVMDRIAVTASLFAGTLSADIIGRPLFPAYGQQVITGYNAKYYGLSGGLNFALPTFFNITPVIRPRAGFLVHQTRVDGENGFEERLSRAAIIFGIGGGFDYPISHTVAFTFGYDLVLMNTDELDGLRSGDRNDALSVFTAGINVLITPGGDPEHLRRPKEERFSTLQSTATPSAQRRGRPTGVGAGEGGVEEPGTAEAARSGNRDENRTVTDEESGKATNEEVRNIARSDGDGSQELRGLTLNPELERDRDEARPVGQGGPLQLFTQLLITPLQRLSDLEENPDNLMLRASQTGSDRMQLKCYVELLRDGVIFYQGNADLMLSGPQAEFRADEFLNLKQLIDMNDGYALLPRGNYLARISTVAWDQDLSSLSKAKFLNVDLRPIFGAKEDEARDVIVKKAVDVAAEGGDELMVNFFQATEAASDRMRLEKKDPERMRASLRLAPVSMTGSARELYLSEEVEQSLNEALKLQSMAGTVGRAENLKVILGEVFFPIDSDLLNEEARVILDNVARLLNQHPELFTEIRGYASDVGDESYNEMLATRRAQRALEYLVRQKMHAYRLMLSPIGKEQLNSAAGDDARLGRKVEIILRNHGM
ncbi:MAG: OmpA family protein [Bacteroidota bacterium]|jgi:outer membrane protein OmpA-like peptidoglycan-associated protein